MENSIKNLSTRFIQMDKQDIHMKNKLKIVKNNLIFIVSRYPKIKKIFITLFKDNLKLKSTNFMHLPRIYLQKILCKKKKKNF